MTMMLRQLSPDSKGTPVSSDSATLAKHISSLRDSIKSNDPASESHQVRDKYFLVDNIWFKSAFVLMTLLNTAQMGAEAEHPEWKSTWTIFENIFTAGFLLEMVVKLVFMKLEYFQDRANWLDCTLVFLGVLDCWILSNLPQASGSDLQSFTILRMLRLARLARVLKLVRAFRPLVLVIRGLTATMSTLGYVFALLMLLVYVAAILLKMSLGDPKDDMYPGYSTDREVIDEQEVMLNYNPAVYFGSMWLSMITLFNMATFNEWQEVVRPIALRQPAYVIIFLCYALLVAFGVMNVMTGLIVDSVITEAKNLEEAQAGNETRERMQNLDKVQKILADMDLDRDGIISAYELAASMKGNDLFTDLLKTVNVPSCFTAEELMSLLDNDGDGALQKHEFTTGFFRLLDSNPFQQVCIMQASINSTKRAVNVANKEVQSKLSALQADIRSIKNALCPADLARAKMNSFETGIDDFGNELVPNEIHQAKRTPAAETELCKTLTMAPIIQTPRTCTFKQLEERIESISHTLLIETLDESYRVMRETFKQELDGAYTIKPRGDTDNSTRPSQLDPEGRIPVWLKMRVPASNQKQANFTGVPHLKQMQSREAQAIRLEQIQGKNGTVGSCLPCSETVDSSAEYVDPVCEVLGESPQKRGQSTI